MRTISTFAQRAIALTFTAAILSACVSGGGHSGGRHGGGSVIPNPHVKVGTPYTIKGITYVPREDPNYNAVGIASWYGHPFHGQLTANGELYDMNRLTAAHKTLPMPSLVRVTNLENGRTIVLRMNDRGPFAEGRIIDLSAEAARRLRMKEQGLAQVRVEYLGRASLDDAIVSMGAPENYAALTPPRTPRYQSRPQPYASSAQPVVAPSATYTHVAYPNAVPATQALPAGYYVQVGAYSAVETVRTVKADLPSAIPVLVTTDTGHARPLHIVRLGPYTHEFAAREAHKVALERGFDDAHIVDLTDAM